LGGKKRNCFFLPSKEGEAGCFSIFFCVGGKLEKKGEISSSFSTGEKWEVGKKRRGGEKIFERVYPNSFYSFIMFNIDGEKMGN